MIDLHCHLLPGVDDGPATLEESLELCRIAVADGITRSIVTPHLHPGRWKNTRRSITSACADLQRKLTHENIPLQLGFAAEVRLSDEVPVQIERSEIPFYGVLDGARVMLLEFPHGQIPVGSLNLIHWLIDRNIRPMIAHPERNRQVMRNVDLLEPYMDAGCLVQLTAGSLVGEFGVHALEVSKTLLERKWVNAVASDGHRVRNRRPEMSQAFDFMHQNYNEDLALALCLDWPKRLTKAQFDSSLADSAG